MAKGNLNYTTITTPLHHRRREYIHQLYPTLTLTPHKSYPSPSSLHCSVGFLAYEVSQQAGVVIRSHINTVGSNNKNSVAGLTEDCWCVLFPGDLTPLTPR